jgi:hypothetical protein
MAAMRRTRPPFAYVWFFPAAALYGAVAAAVFAGGFALGVIPRFARSRRLGHGQHMDADQRHALVHGVPGAGGGADCDRPRLRRTLIEVNGARSSACDHPGGI